MNFTLNTCRKLGLVLAVCATLLLLTACIDPPRSIEDDISDAWNTMQVEKGLTQGAEDHALLTEMAAEKAWSTESAKPQASSCFYVASSNREPFHFAWCEWALRIAPYNLECYSTRNEAIAAGHRPCKVCGP